MDYEGKESIYFDARFYSTNVKENQWPHRLFTPVEFGNTMDDEIKVSIPVRITGPIKDYDRAFSVEVVTDSTTATSEEYTGLQNEYVIKAGEYSTNVEFVAHRTTRIDGDTVQLQLRLIPNSHFDVCFPNYDEENGYFISNPNMLVHKIPQFDVNFNAGIHNIFIYDVMMQPSGWYGTWEGGGTFGGFSAKKIRLMMEVCGLTLEDFATKGAGGMPSGRSQAVGEQFGKYLLEQAKKGREYAVIDENGTMMWVNYVTTNGGTAKWTWTTTPEEYYKYK